MREFTFGVLVVETDHSRIRGSRALEPPSVVRSAARRGNGQPRRAPQGVGERPDDRSGGHRPVRLARLRVRNPSSATATSASITERSGLDPLRRNTVTGHPEAGIILEGSGNRYPATPFADNVDGAIVSGDDNVVAGNRLSGPSDCPGGVRLRHLAGGRDAQPGRSATSSCASTRRHPARRVRGVRRAADDREHPSREPRHGTTVDGVLIESTAPHAVERNFVLGAGDDGIDVGSPATTMTRNRALNNGDLGIEAVLGVTDGGGNFAARNGNPLQCTQKSRRATARRCRHRALQIQQVQAIVRQRPRRTEIPGGGASGPVEPARPPLDRRLPGPCRRHARGLVLIAT